MKIEFGLTARDDILALGKRIGRPIDERSDPGAPSRNRWSSRSLGVEQSDRIGNHQRIDELGHVDDLAILEGEAVEIFGFDLLAIRCVAD